MQKSGDEMRVRRLVTSGLCPSRNATKYVKELKELTNKVDEKKLKQQSKIFKALSDLSRLKILLLLGTRDMCVCEIMVALDMSQPTASHHIGILENASLVKFRREGKWSFYGLTSPDILSFLDKIQSLV